MQTIVEQLESVLNITGPSPRGWYKLPACPICKRKQKMYFHPKNGYKCWSAKCGVSGSVQHFPIMMRECGYRIALFQIPRLEVKDIFEEKQVNRLDLPVRIELPEDSYLFTKEKLPTYFVKERKIPGYLILDLKMRYCLGGMYNNRIIIPLETMSARGFLAYATKRYSQDKKVLYPKGCQISKFLFPYNYVAKKNPHRIILCEGVTDALRILSHVPHLSPDVDLPLALLGKNLSLYHIKAIKKLVDNGLKEIVCCLDSDASKYNETTAIKLSRKFGRDKVSLLSMNELDYRLRQKIIDDNSMADEMSLDPGDIYEYDTWQEVLDTRESLYRRLI